jgi:hypothetical protein
MKPISMAKEWQIQAKGWAAVAEERRARMEQAAQKLQILTRYKLERYGGDDGGGDLVEDSNGHWLDADDVVQIIQDLEGKP